MKKSIISIALVLCILSGVASPVAVHAKEPETYMVPNYQMYQNFMTDTYPVLFRDRLYLATLDASTVYQNYFDIASTIIGEDLSVERCIQVLANMATLMNYQLEEAIVEQATMDTTMTLYDYGVDLADIAAGVVGTDTFKKAADSVMKGIATTMGIANGVLDVAVDTKEELELLMQLEGDFSMQYDFLETVYMYADIPEMKEAAQTLMLANEQIMIHKLEVFNSTTSATAKFAAHDVFLDQVAEELLKDPDFFDSDAWLAVKALSTAYSLYSGAKLAFDITMFLGDMMFGTHDIYNRYNEMVAMRDIRQALLARVEANPALNEEDYDNMDRNISLMKMSLYIDAHGEYCVYKMITEDGKLAKLFSTTNHKSVEENYNASVRLIENSFENLEILYCETEWDGIENIFEELPAEFIFTSGAGGWMTALNIADDGTFTGEYYDSNNDEIYICNFSGRFSKPKKINDYMYSMNLESLTQEGTPGEIYYENDFKYIVSEPYGLDNADQFYIYLPGTPIADLPDGFLSWAHLGNPPICETTPSDYYGIYNVGGEQGFVGTADTETESGGTAPNIPTDLENITLSRDEQYCINVFLSNFSELWFWEYADYEKFETRNASAGEMISFVYHHCWVNNQGVLSSRWGESGVYMTLDEINNEVGRFFNRSVTLEDAASSGYHVEGDRIYNQVGIGETYDHMTVADAMWKKADGTYIVDFSIYQANDKYDAGPGLIGDKSVYYLTPDEAKTDVGVLYYMSGVAEVSPYLNNGKDTYQLISYQLNPKEEEIKPSEEPQLEMQGIPVSTEILVGEWNVDTELTMDYNGLGMTSMFGRPYVDSMSFGADNEFQYWITFYGGDGQYAVDGEYVVYNIETPYGDKETGKMQLVSIDGTEYLIHQMNPHTVFWKKS